MHGADVWDAYLQGGLARIREYCETDVLNTYLIFLRFELLRGHLEQDRTCPRNWPGPQAPGGFGNGAFQGIRRSVARGITPSEVHEADIVDLSHDGRGVARIDGKAVFIEGALPGERVRLRVVKRRRQMDEAGLVEVLTASPDRATPRCAALWDLRRLFPAASVGRGADSRETAAIAGESSAHRQRASRAGARRRCADRNGPTGAGRGSGSSTCTRRAGCWRAFANATSPILPTCAAARY